MMANDTAKQNVCCAIQQRATIAIPDYDDFA